MEQDINVLIIPLDASIRSGESQEFRCQVQPNATMERTWVLFQKGGPTETITSSTCSIAGDVTFSTDTKESLLLKPRTGDTHYFIECSVKTVDGRKVSAFASIHTHEEANGQSSTEGMHSDYPTNSRLLIPYKAPLLGLRPICFH